MDLNCLRVYNVMYKLGFDEEDFTRIEKLQTANTSGLSIAAYKKKRAVYIDHEEKNNIMVFNSRRVVVPSLILFKTMVTFRDIPEQIFRLHKMLRYRAQDKEIKNTAHNIEELKTIIRDRIEKRESYYNIGLEDKKDYEAIFWLFDAPVVEDKHKIENGRDIVVKVFEMKNKRFAIIKSKYNNQNEEMSLETFTTKTLEYDYVDEGREFLHHHHLWIDDSLKGKLTGEELRVIAGIKENNENKDFILLTGKIYGEIQNKVRMEMLAARRNINNKQAVEQMKNTAHEEFNTKGETIRDGITISKTKISDKNNSFSGHRLAEYVIQSGLLYNEHLDFNVLLKNYIDYLTQKYSYSEKISVTSVILININNIQIMIECEKNVLYLNSHRIRSDELVNVILKALFINMQDEYNQWVADVSKVSLRMKKALEVGLTYKLAFGSGYGGSNNETDIVYGKKEQHYNHLKIERIDNANYVVYKDKKFKIQDSNALFDLAKDIDLDKYYHGDVANRTIKLLFRALKDITPQDISNILKDGIKYHHQRIKNSKEFINIAVKKTNAEVKSDGWVVKGISGKSYHISNSTYKIEVYTWEKGKKDRYLCIIDVDDENTDEATMNDKIAKRILALSQDKTIAKEIFTLDEYLTRRETGEQI